MTDGLTRHVRVAPIAASLPAVLSASCARSLGGNWSPQAAAGYLDQRATRWMNWRASAREHGTVCVSCHTALPYALARANLARLLHETSSPVPQRRLIANVQRRVQGWSQLQPYYKDKSSQDSG
jgi:squalene-hopene/tetraprenyl-beta-curcumene cyclase